MSPVPGVLYTGSAHLLPTRYSYGVTAEELAYLLIELDVKDAALLDGGASTEMIFDGEVVNKPSYQGEERPMASAFVVIKRD